MAKFVKARGIAYEPAFTWWVPYTVRKRDVILSAIKWRIRKTTHKYGIEIPTSIKHGHRLVKENGNNLWRETNATKMHNVRVAFEVLPEGQKPPIGWSNVNGHFIWDLKTDFTRKERLVLDGHKNPNPIGSTYSGVVSSNSVCIAFTYEALNST